MLREEREEHQHDKDRENNVEDRRGNAQDHLRAEVGEQIADHDHRDHRRPVDQLAVRQLLQALGAGGGQADRRGQACRRHDQPQQQPSVVPHQMMGDRNQQRRTIRLGKRLHRCTAGHGGAEVGKASVHDEQAEACDDAAQADHAHLLARVRDAGLLHGQQRDHAQQEHAQHIHRLIAGLQSVGKRNADRRGFRHLAQGMNDADRNEQQQRRKHQRREDLADDVHDLAGPQAQQRDCAEVNQAEHPRHPRLNIGQQRPHADVKGGRRRARHGDQRADAKRVEEAQNKGALRRQLPLHRVDKAAARLYKGQQRQHR